MFWYSWLGHDVERAPRACIASGTMQGHRSIQARLIYPIDLRLMQTHHVLYL